MNTSTTSPNPAYTYTPVNQAINLAVKQSAIDLFDLLITAPLPELTGIALKAFGPDAPIHITHPINDLPNHTEALNQFWLPLRQALPDVERRLDIVAAGLFRDSHWMTFLGSYLGTFARNWLGIPATGGVVTVRFAEAHEVRDGKIVTSYMFIDFLDLMLQAGFWPIGPSRGKEMPWLPPKTHEGVLLTPQPNDQSEQTIQRVLAMQNALGFFPRTTPTREALDSMQQVKHWHPNFMWYGPCGIGSTRGLHGFELYHQIPFLTAFPDRGGTPPGHFIRIGDGHFAVTGGWGYLQATHTGGEFLGMPPTGKRIKMRVMDFYRCDDLTICENWIPMDIPHILLQMGVDVFARLSQTYGR